MKSQLCGCGNVRRAGGRYCLLCHAAYLRRWRRVHRQTGEQRARQNCRRYALVYLQRGKLKKGPCEVCGDPNSQMHHEDYGKPLMVRWLCRKHHLELQKID